MLEHSRKKEEHETRCQIERRSVSSSMSLCSQRELLLSEWPWAASLFLLLGAGQGSHPIEQVRICWPSLSIHYSAHSPRWNDSIHEKCVKCSSTWGRLGRSASAGHGDGLRAVVSTGKVKVASVRLFKATFHSKEVGGNRNIDKNNILRGRVGLLKFDKPERVAASIF